jgi:hypothetical protein
LSHQYRQRGYGLQPFETEAIVNANIVTDEYQYVGTYDPIEVTDNVRNFV